MLICEYTTEETELAIAGVYEYTLCECNAFGRVYCMDEAHDKRQSHTLSLCFSEFVYGMRFIEANTLRYIHFETASVITK